MKTNILGVQVDSVTQKQALDKVTDFLNSDKQHHLVTANPEIALIAWENDEFRNLINTASLVMADGIGLIWAAKFLKLPCLPVRFATRRAGRKSSNILTSLIQVIVSGISLILYPNYCKDVLPERVAGVDFMEKICELVSSSRVDSKDGQASKNYNRIYLLGGEEGIAEKTATVLRKKYLNLNIVDFDQGPLVEDTRHKIHDTRYTTQDTIDKINSVKPVILFVAFGAPKQEYWLNENLKKMPSVKVAMGVGGAFNFISGNSKRAPQIYQDLGLEWLYRLFNEPWRAIRIFNATVKFIYTVIRFKHKINEK